MGAYHQSLMPLIKPEAKAYMPTRLVDWFYRGSLSEAFAGDLLVGLYEVARDFNCVGGMLFPVFCFVYWPFLVLLSFLGLFLPAQRVEDDGLTFAQFRLG